MKPSREPEQQRGPDGSRPIWTVVFVLSAVALIAVLSFGSGIVAERYVFSGTWLGTERLRGGLETDGNPEVDAAFPRQAEVREILEDEYFFLPASPEARATFWADVERGHRWNGDRGGHAGGVARRLSPRARLRRGARHDRISGR